MDNDKAAIWKYVLKVDDGEQRHAVPRGSELISVVSQYDEPVAYFMVDPKETATVKFNYAIWGTGHIHDWGDVEGLGHFATVVTHGGKLVWHVFVGIEWK